jgi:hypothetical protein
MEDSFPNIGSMSDEELKAVFADLAEDEREVSYRRRILHGRIDVQKLTDILVGRVPDADEVR